MAKEKYNNEAARLQKFIESENLTQQELGEIINKPQPTVNKYLKGVLNIPLDVVKTLHLKLNLNVNWFIAGTKPMKLDKQEKNNTLSNTMDILLSQSIIMAKLDDMDTKLKKVYGDFYEFKNQN